MASLTSRDYSHCALPVAFVPVNNLTEECRDAGNLGMDHCSCNEFHLINLFNNK